MLSHNVIALYGTIAIGCYVVLTISNVRWPVTVMAGGALGAAMAAYFWLRHWCWPSSLMPVCRRGRTCHRQSLLRRICICTPSTGTVFVERLGIGGSIAGPDDPMGINLGIAVLIGIVFAAIAVFRPGLSRGQRYRLCICLVLVGIFLSAMSPQMNWAQCPQCYDMCSSPGVC